MPVPELSIAYRLPFHEARIVAFDNDGTLYPAGKQVAAAVLDAHREYVREQGLDVETPTMEWVHRNIGADALDFYGSMLPGYPEQVRQQFEEFCVDFEREAVQRHSELFEGAVDLLAALHAAGKLLALVTNGSPRYVDCVWDAAGYHRWFSCSYPFQGPEYTSKGHRLKQAIEQLGGGPAVMVGDRASDRDAAREAGVWFIGCRYGYGAMEEIEPADAQAHSVHDLFELLLSCAAI
jgi:phosphoglycolate phosphatase